MKTDYIVLLVVAIGGFGGALYLLMQAHKYRARNKDVDL